MSGRLLITGATGCVGRAVIASAASRGWDVRGLARTRAPLSAEIVLGDVRDRDAVERAARGCDAIVHAAGWVHRVSTTAADRAELRSSIVDGTRVVADATARLGARLILVSSVAVTHARTDYALAKLAAEEVARERCADLAVVRPTVVFGAHDRGNVAALIDAIERGRAFVVGDGSNRKSVVAADNLADRLVMAAERRALRGTWIAADAPAPTQAELMTAIARALGRRPPRRLPQAPLEWAARAVDLVSRRPRWRARIRQLAAGSEVDGAPFDAALAYTPHTPWIDALETSVRWHVSRR